MKKGIDHSERLLILEMGYERHETEMRELRVETKILTKSTNDLMKTNSQIRYIALGIFITLIVEKYGILTVVEKLF